MAERLQSDRSTAILRGAAKLFARKGVRSTTVREIADESGVLSGTLYHYFPSKEAIVDEIVTRYLDALLSRYHRALAPAADPRARLHGLVVASLECAKVFPHATQIYQNELGYLRQRPGYERIKAAVYDVQQAWIDVIEDGRAHGVFRDDVPPRMFYRLIRDAVWLSVRWYRPDGSYPIDQFARDTTSVFLQGIGR
ncbi:TetR/AcrR family transcriptional regulator [Amycolatopsis rhizosphaerae]|uniref:TetR/AcrR family transcriptional regulator n=1 Tax=Amycolatopsis rhizosphaerae TaxID=2053003 RepID=A0A558DJY7_9PSEU|nr:TetR/AcrR family transcriptional regulator [Amycolatopsis rhizosphaerae]TVT61331.1 TetR/AcrR family transcriptional regulator [Amycolatopsis rhizosphaerae]